MQQIELYKDKSECCGCGACMNICSKSAIKMELDENGFLFPKIDRNLCVNCGACKMVCGCQNPPKLAKPISVYAAASKKSEILINSASGGISAVLSRHIVQMGGVVYGAALKLENGKLAVKHICIDKLENLNQIQGSKYVQSDLSNCFASIKKDLMLKKKVMFTGTPCQVASLKKYIKKEDENLLTIEIICHGVPNQKMFQDFLEYEGKKKDARIIDFTFRDKSKGQGMLSKMVYLSDSTNKAKEKIKIGETLSYYYLFLNSYIYRESCYSCPFANENRVADLTIGDFWGFHEEYPNFKSVQGLSNDAGISCVLVNSKQGEKIFEDCQSEIFYMNSDFEKVARHNAQLKQPSSLPKKRNEIFTNYNKYGYSKLDKYVHHHFAISIAKNWIRGKTPKRIKRFILRIKGKIK